MKLGDLMAPGAHLDADLAELLGPDWRHADLEDLDAGVVDQVGALTARGEAMSEIHAELVKAEAVERLLTDPSRLDVELRIAVATVWGDTPPAHALYAAVSLAEELRPLLDSAGRKKRQGSR